MIHYGDITKINGHEVPLVDVICGGSPCQDLSVAGKRAGLSGERSGLFMEQIRLVKEMRDESERQLRMQGTDDIRGRIQPRYLVWENVCGAFSSNSGGDFHAVLEEIAKVAEGDASIPGPPNGKWPYAGCIVADGWSVGWRVHDAQFWGVPQRRRRISVVADFGGSTAPEILFERKGLSGDTEQGGTQRKTVAGNPEERIDPTGAARIELSGTLGVSQDQTLITKVIGFNRERGGANTMEDMMPTLQAAAGESGNNQPMVCEPIVVDTNQNDASIHQDGKTNTLPAAMGMGGGYVPMVCGERVGVEREVVAFEPGAASRVGGHVYEDGKAGTVRANAGDNQQAVVYGISSYDSNSMKSDNPHSGIYEAETSRTLDLNGGSPACNQGGMAVVCLEGNGSRPSHQGDGYSESETMYTLNTIEKHAVCVENHPNDSRCKVSEDGIVQTLSSRMGTGGNNTPMVMETYQKTTGSSWDGSQISPTLTANNANGAQRMPDKDNFNAVISMTTEMTPKIDEDDMAFSLRSRDYKDPQSVAYGLDRAAYNQGANAQYNFSVDEEKVGTSVAKGPNAVCTNAIVRRLTPMECERLQNFPDHWTDIGDWVDSKGKKHKGESDAPRYKALGNSIALPFWSWMAERMVRHLRASGVERPTMASLFDGIGGFPLVYSEVGCDPVWASEIEEFPIAVTKIRFPEV